MWGAQARGIEKKLPKDWKAKGSVMNFLWCAVNIIMKFRTYLPEVKCIIWDNSFFSHIQAWANCPVEMMLRRTRWISDRTSDKTFFWKNFGHQDFAWFLKQSGATAFLINIKLTYANVHQHPIQPQQFLKST